MIGPFETYALRNPNHLGAKALGLGVLWTVSMVSQSVIFALATVVVLAWFNQRWSRSGGAFGWVLSSCFLFSLPGLAVVGVDLGKLARQGWFEGGLQGWVANGTVFDFRRCAELSGVFLGTTSCMFTLLLNVPVVTIFTFLGRLGLPSLLVELLYLILRQIQNLAGFSQALLIGQRSRLGDATLRSRWLGLTLAVPKLLVEAMSMADASYQALEARSWGGQFRSLEGSHGPATALLSRSRAMEWPAEIWLWLGCVSGLAAMGILCRSYDVF